MELTGALDIFGFPNLLRAAEIHHKSFSLEILHPAARAGVCVQDGQVFWSRAGRVEGEEVIRTVCGWQGADFWVYPLSTAVPLVDTIRSSEFFGRFPELLTSSTPAVSTDEVTGEIGVFGVRDLLHVFRLSGGPATLRVANPQGRGEVQVSAGLVLLARWGEIEGREALDALFELKNGTLRIVPGSPAGLDHEPIDLGPLLGLDESGDLLEEEPERIAVAAAVETVAGAVEPEEAPPAEASAEAPAPAPGRARARREDETRTFKLMKLPRQVQIARRGNTRQRVGAACSNHDRVAMAVVSDRNFGMDLAETIAANSAVNPKVLEFLGSDPSTRGAYQVIYNIVTNPATPVDTAVELLPRISDRHLRLIVQNGFSHAQAIRSRARTILAGRKKKRGF